MSTSYITAIGVANPPTRVAQPQIASFMAQALQLSPIEERKLKMFYKSTAIAYRHSVIEDYGKLDNFDFFPNTPTLEPFPTTAKRMELYEKYATDLCIEAVNQCFDDQNMLYQVTHLITVSCTGMFAPGIDIELIERLKLSSYTQRICINFMGCYAAFNALKVADAICKADQQANVLIVNVELCTLHFQKENTENHILANAIFADGAAAMLVQSKASQKKAISLEGFYCDLAFEGREDMAWFVRDWGFEMQLSSYVPSLLESKMKDLIVNLLQKFSLTLEQIDTMAIHPGGKKILETAEKVLNISAEKNKYSYQVLKNYGNMSSVTVVFVLKNILENFDFTKDKANILSMAFGPGLTIESALLQIHQ
ncbi:MAG: type III polyketide synthase [Thermoflexibacter sp.]|nr:type III polyketide synthase [Thermoflexibacter sp.]